ncbi:hypothetical protein FOA52_002847 [Chlamydomonas sp. UWO 241]|nr:hypothetical protein FOA52_002847 [Chlamydomonas sp. UWO 241]
MLSFVARSGVTVTASRLTFTKSIAKPLTVITDAPLTPTTGVRTRGFEVAMPTKQARTAIGFSADPELATYMTPTYSPGLSSYISMGGAGFIYPAGASSSGRYGEGDTLRCEVDFSARTVSFSVNGQRVGSAPWRHGEAAWPAISSEGGTVVADVDFF